MNKLRELNAWSLYVYNIEIHMNIEENFTPTQRKQKNP